MFAELGKKILKMTYLRNPWKGSKNSTLFEKSSFEGIINTSSGEGGEREGVTIERNIVTILYTFINSSFTHHSLILP